MRNQGSEIGLDWFWVEYGDDGAQTILRDMNPGTGIRETNDVLRMVDHGAPREARLTVDYDGYIHNGYPQYTGLGGVSSYNGGIPAFYSGNQSINVWTEVTAGYFEPAPIQIVDENRTSVTFSASNLGSFHGAVNQFLSGLGAPSGLNISDSLTFETKYVDKYGNASNYARFYKASRVPGLKFSLPSMSFSTSPIPVWGPTSVVFAVSFSAINSTLAGAAQYDPSQASPFSGGLSFSVGSAVSATASYGINGCSSYAAIVAGGPANVTIDSQANAKTDGVYMSGSMNVGSVVADVKVEVSANGQCVVRFGYNIPITDGATFDFFSGGEMRVYTY